MAKVVLYTRYDASRSVSDPAAKRKLPSGSTLKALGRSSVDTCPTAANRPEEAEDGLHRVHSHLSVSSWRWGSDSSSDSLEVRSG